MGWREITSGIMDAAQANFGEAVSYVRVSDPTPVEVRGIFQAAHLATNPDTHADIHTTQPRIDFRQDDLGFEPAEGDEVIVAGVTYRVMESQFDGWARVRLFLVEL